MENSDQVCVDTIITIDNFYRVNKISFLNVNKHEISWILLHTVKKNTQISLVTGCIFMVFLLQEVTVPVIFSSPNLQ